MLVSVNQSTVSVTSMISSSTASISFPLLVFSRRNRAKFLDISKKQLVLDSGAFRDFPGLLNYTVIIPSEYHKGQGRLCPYVTHPLCR